MAVAKVLCVVAMWLPGGLGWLLGWLLGCCYAVARVLWMVARVVLCGC